MRHTYLTEVEINKALQTHSITKKEATKLKKKMDLQKTIRKITTK